MASPVPVLPDVGSTIVPPGSRRPERSAASMRATATRSLIDPPGLSASTLATSCGVSPAPRRERRTSGVLPMASRIEPLMSTVGPAVMALMIRSVPSVRSCYALAEDPAVAALLAADSSAADGTMPCVPNDDLDGGDRRLLELLAADARISNARLAAAVGVAPSTALARVRSLRARGVIRGFHAEAGLPPLGRPLQALVAIRLSVHSREQIESFTEHVRTLAGVLSIFHVTGQTDYLLWVAAADAHDLREFVVEHLASDPAVSHAETSLIYEQRRGPGVFGADPA